METRPLVTHYICATKGFLFERSMFMHYQKKFSAVLTEQEVDPKVGLSDEQVKARQLRDGKNTLPGKKKKTIIGVVLSQLKDVMIYVLLAAAAISLGVEIYHLIQEARVPGIMDFIEVIVILVVVLINAVVGTIQELKADKALDALEKLAAPTTVVRRNGQLMEIKAEELVVGDIVILEEGRTVPADLRLISSINLKAGEASLTGESVPVEKDANLVFASEVPLGDRRNLVYMSTPITYGRGEGVVVATGLKTEIGKIANMLNNEDDSQTPLQARLQDLAKLLGIITLGIVALIFIISIVQQITSPGGVTIEQVIEDLMTAIALAVAAVPEGLPAIVAITLSMGVRRMVKVNTITRKLPSVETLGAVSVICSDKTGTLTQNKMTVVAGYVNDQIYRTSEFDTPLHELAIGMSLCSNASVDNGVYGDPTEIALVEFANVFDYRKDAIEEKHPRIDELPFDSVRKMMSTVNVIDGINILFTKGAMDSILKRTTHIKVDGVVRKITTKDFENINKAANEMAANALRVLALASKEHDGKQIEEENLTFIGLVGMVDPPRPEAAASVAKLNSAGIRTIMITGDHVDTAFAIGKELGIANDIGQTMMGEEIDKLSEEELSLAVEHTNIFARVSPENKVQIVKALKANGHIVAMTGDGVNDAPSLKAADIGIAMGITGTDVAKGAADMVLSDDNFVSIGLAVEEGRGIYENIKKTVWFLLSSNFGEVFSMLVAIILGFPAPLAVLHILWVNLVTDTVPALALGADAKDPDNMKDKPRDPKQSLFAKGGYALTLTYGAIVGLLTLIAFVIPGFQAGAKDLFAVRTLLNTDADLLRTSQTFAFTVLGVSQLFHMLGMSNIRKTFFRLFSPKEAFVWFAFLIGFVLQILVTEVPFLTAAFGTTSLSLNQWLLLAAIATGPLVLHEIIVFVRFIKLKLVK